MAIAAPLTESERLRILQRYAILDTPPEEAFDRVAGLAARLLNMPVGLVSLTDEKRQWFKAAYGVTIRDIPRDGSFCGCAIRGEEILIVPDATQDPRFAGNSLVTGEMGIRFYAGVPLRGMDGAMLGTLCILDTRPRQLDAEQQAILLDLAEIAMGEFQSRWANLEKNQLAAAVFNAGAGVVVTDPRQPDNPIIYVNPAFCMHSGYAPEELMGHNCRFLQGPGTDGAVLDDMRAAIKNQRLFQGIILNYRKDGSSFWNELIISPVFDENNQLINYVGLQNNVTARKVSEDNLREGYIKLQQMEQLRDSLTSMIIHDMRSPLNLTITSLELLRCEAEGQLNSEALEAIQFAERGVHQLKDMVTSLLDVSRLESGNMPLEITEFDLAELAMDCLGTQLAIYGPDRLQLEAPPGPLRVRCDKTLVCRAMDNLVSNSLKFTSATGEVRVRLDKQGAAVSCSVTDTGPGIAREHHARIFEKFGQVKGKRDAHSSGLGLAFCKLAIEAQGGMIGVESEVGKGSTFWFTLPSAD